jgi:glycolate oxidase FAD binding subunit
VIVEATFMIRPRPEDQAVLMLRFPSVDTAMQVALEKVYAELQPFFLELTNFDPLQKSTGGFWLFVGLAGIPEDVDYQRQRLRMLENDTDSSIEEITGEAVQNLAVALRDFPVTGEAGLRCKTSLLPDQVAEFCTRVEEEVGLRGMSVQLQARAGNGIVYSRFIRPDDMPPGKLLSLLDWLRIQTKRMNGYTVVEEVEPSLKDRVDVWGHVGATFPLMKKLKETFDPNELLNPGRFVGGL